MTRFQPYRLVAQAGDNLILSDVRGQTRKVPWKVVPVPMGLGPEQFVVCLTTGAWVEERSEAFMTLWPAPALNAVDALTALLREIRRHGVIYDQLDRAD